jgi:hypothetical protein
VVPQVDRGAGDEAAGVAHVPGPARHAVCGDMKKIAGERTRKGICSVIERSLQTVFVIGNCHNCVHCVE